MNKWIAVVLAASIIGVVAYKKQPQEQPVASVRPVEQFPTLPPKPVEPEKPKTYNISTPVPTYLDYPQIVAQISKWNQEAPEITEIGTYGKTRQGTDLCYLKIGKKGPKVMITGCIHGNEPHATANVMACTGTMLSEYGKNPEVTSLIDSRIIYIIPVISPDSYPHSRHVDGVDPNRDFPGPHSPNHKSTPSIAAVQDFFMKVRPNAVISTHTFGRIYLTPYGDKYQKCPNESDYQRIVGKMGQMSSYKVDRACNMYARPILGSEVDWYYRNGAFAIVMEVGTHQRKPSLPEIQSEFQRTYKSVLLFIQEAPVVEIKK